MLYRTEIEHLQQPTETSTPIQQQRKRLSMKLSRSYKTMTTQQYSTGGLPITDHSHSSEEEGGEFDWGGEEIEIEMPLGVELGMDVDSDDQEVRKRRPVTSDYSPPSALRGMRFLPADVVANGGSRGGGGGESQSRQRENRNSNVQARDTRSTVSTRVESFVVPLNDADDGVDGLGQSQGVIPRAQEGMETSNRTIQPQGRGQSPSHNPINPSSIFVTSTSTNNRLRAIIPLPFSVSNRDDPPFTPPAQRTSATVRRVDSSSEISNVKHKERLKKIDPSSPLAPSKATRLDELMNSEKMTDEDSFDEIPRGKKAMVITDRAGGWVVPMDSERHGLGTFDETDEKGSTKRTQGTRNDEYQEEYDEEDESVERPRGRDGDSRRNEVLLSPGRYEDQQDQTPVELNNPQDPHTNNDKINDTTISRIPRRNRFTKDQDYKHSNDTSPRPTTEVTSECAFGRNAYPFFSDFDLLSATQAYPRPPLSHLPALYNIPPPSPLSFSMTADAYADSNSPIESISLRRVWKDTYPAVVTPREIEMDCVPGEVERRKRYGSAVTDDDEGGEQDRQIEKRRRVARRKEKRAKDDQEGMDLDGEVRMS